MITEQKQEMACLYALGALPADEATSFESVLKADGELRQFTRRLSEVTAVLALSAGGSKPSANLKQKVLASIAASEKVVRADFQSEQPTALALFQWLPWAAAASVTIACALLYQQNSTLKRDVNSLAAQSSEQRVLLGSLQVELADWKARDRMSQVKIAMLGSLLESSPKAVAISVWDADKQDGLLVVQNLAPQPADKDYQLWVIDPQHGAPVDAGVFTVDEKGNVRFRFKPKVSVQSADKFAVTLEKKGGVAAPAGTMVLAGTWL